MSEPLRTLEMTDDELQAEARHLRTLAGLVTGDPTARQGWGVGEVVDVDGAPPPRGLQAGELVLVAPYLCGDKAVLVHSRIRAQDIAVPPGVRAHRPAAEPGRWRLISCTYVRS